MKQLIVDSNSAKQMVVDYINASNEVSKYAVSVMSANLPALVSPPDHYGDYADTLATAKIDASVWLDEVIPDFTAIPSAFINFNSLLQAQLGAVQNGLNGLKADPGNSAIIQNIRDTIARLTPETSTIQKTLSGLDSNISEYQTSIKPDADCLSQLTAQIAAGEKIDESAIAQMNTVYQNFQSIIDDRNEVATLNTAFEFTEGIFLAAVGVAIGVVFTGGAGIIIGGIFGIASTAFTVFVPLQPDPDFNQSIKDIQNEMNDVNKEIGVLNTIVAQLQQLSATFTTLVTNSENAGAQMQTVLGFWQALEGDLTKLVTDVEDILAGINDPADIDQLISDVEDAQNSWNDVESFMTLIQDLKVTVVQLGATTPTS